MGSVEVPLQEPWKLYVMHLCFSFVSRTWDMGIALLLAKLTNNSLFIVALTGFMCSLSVFLFGSVLGSMLDKTDRLSAMVVGLSVKLIGVTLGYGICAWLLYSSATVTINDTPVLFINPASGWLIYSIPVVNALAHLSFSMVNLAVEKDWVVVLSANDGAWLSRTNAVMSQLDMFCAALAPLVTGVVFDAFSGGEVAILLLACNAVVTVAFYCFVRLLYFSFPSLQVRTQADDDVETERAHVVVDDVEDPSVVRELGEDTPLLPATNSGGTSSSSGRGNVGGNTRLLPSSGSLHARFQQCFLCDEFLQRSGGCAGVMLSYAFLYLTVLSFGPLMTVYLVWAGVSLPWIGMLRGCNALSGFLGATLFPIMVHRIGVWKTGQVSIIYQCILVIVAAGSLYWFARSEGAVQVAESGSGGGNVISTGGDADPASSSKLAEDVVNPGMEFAGFFLAFLVVFSRAGLWAFDLAARQIAQQCIPENYRGRVNGQWKSVIGLFDMTSFAIACVFSNPAQFALLATVSATMVFLATVAFSYANFNYHHVDANLQRENCVGVITGAHSRRRSEAASLLLQEETLLQNNDYIDNFSKQPGSAPVAPMEVEMSATRNSSGEAGATGSRGGGTAGGARAATAETAPFGRKDRPHQSSGSVLGEADPHPAVVRSRGSGNRGSK